jgi:hypothetical protein
MAKDVVVMGRFENRLSIQYITSLSPSVTSTYVCSSRIVCFTVQYLQLECSDPNMIRVTYLALLCSSLKQGDADGHIGRPNS